MKFREPKSMPCRDLDQLYPIVKAKALQLAALCNKAGIPITITQTYRSSRYQQALYDIGRTRQGNKVTNCKPGTSPHEYRIAFDVCMNIKGYTWDAAMLKKVGEYGKTLGLQWGGEFKTLKDYPHFQYLGCYTMSQIKSGKIPV